LRAASLTVNALLDSAQFGAAAGEKAPLVRIGKFTTETAPLQVAVTATRTFALVSEPVRLGRIVIWTAQSQYVAYHLISCACPSCFVLHRDGRFVIAGTESGSVLLWDVARIETIKTDGASLVLPPQVATDCQAGHNQRQAIVAVTVFGRGGANVVCSLDNGSVVNFWYLRGENTDVALVKAETVKLSTGFLPTFSLAMLPGSVSGFLIGAGGRIYNSCRFGSPTAPPVFGASGAIRAIAFSPVFPSIFGAAGDNGKLGIYDVDDADPLLELTINLSLGDVGVIWSPTRASVFFVSDVSGRRVLIFDLLVSLRAPVHVHSVGSATQDLAVTLTKSGVVLAVAEAGLAVTLFRVSDDLSRPLRDAEMGEFKILLCHLTRYKTSAAVGTFSYGSYNS
jgi:WD40 repeat protein